MFLSGKNGCIISRISAFRFSDEVFAMTKAVEDLQMLRLITAFQKITDKDARRLILMFVEEQLEKPPGKA